MHKIFVVAVLSVSLIACSKEEVKPFNAGGSAANMSTKSLSDGTDDSHTTGAEENGVTVGEDENSTNSEGEGSVITDGGTSSDYDTKGTKRKPGKN